MLLRRGRVLLLLLPLACVCGCAAAPAGGGTASGRTPIPADLALLTFDSAWSRIAHSHYDEDYGGVDWPAVRTALRPRAAAARSLDELRHVLDEMLAQLHDSHYALIRRESVLRLEGAEGSVRDGGASAASTAAAAGNAGGAGAAMAVEGEAGLDVRLVEGELLVTRVRPNGAAAAAGVRMGWTLLAINGREVGRRIAALDELASSDRRVARTSLLHSIAASLRGAPGDTLVLGFRDADGAEATRRLLLRRAPGQVIRYGNLPPMLATLEADRIETVRGCIGVVRLSLWAVPLLSALDDAVDRNRGCAGMILDLRGNPGGVGGMVMGAAGHFVNDTVALGHMRMRTGELRYMVNPRRVRHDGAAVVPFAGPVAVLMDEMSASTSEIFAAGLQALGRARIFGTASAGQALPALMVRLPTGDVLLHVVADFTAPDGTRIEGRGVLPDVAVTVTRGDLLARRDPPLEAAVRWITHEAHEGARP